MTARFRKRLCLGLAALGTILAGCGDSAGLAPKTQLLCGFENLPDADQGKPQVIPDTLKKPGISGDDYGWATGGYVSLTPMKKYATQGKYSAEARFTVPTDYKSLSDSAGLATWEAGMTLSSDSATKLAVTDWSDYGSLKADFFNPGDSEYPVYLRVVDTHSNMTETAGVVTAKGKSSIAMSVTQLAQARLYVNDIKLVTLYMNTAKLRSDPVIYIDNLRLERGSAKK